MGEYVATGLSGEGHSPFDTSAHLVLSVWINVTTPSGKARIIGSMEPKDMWAIGKVGLGSFPDDAYMSDPPWTGWETFITNDNKNYPVAPFITTAQFFVSVWWRLAPGAVITLAVEW